MVYRKIVEGWMQNRLNKGSTLQEAYNTIFGELDTLRRFYSGLVDIQTHTTGDVTEPMDVVRHYVRAHGFQEDGQWYFRPAWLPPYIREFLENEDFIQRIGTPNDMKAAGITIPVGHKRNGAVTYYVVNPEKLEA